MCQRGQAKINPERSFRGPRRSNNRHLEHRPRAQDDGGIRRQCEEAPLIAMGTPDPYMPVVTGGEVRGPFNRTGIFVRGVLDEKVRHELQTPGSRHSRAASIFRPALHSQSTDALAQQRP